MRALPTPSIALKQSTLRAGRSAGGDDARTARERDYKPRPQEPHSLRAQVCLEITPLDERDSPFVTVIGTNVKRSVAVEVTIYLLPGVAAKQVTRIERGEMRGYTARLVPDFALLNPGYACCRGDRKGAPCGRPRRCRKGDHKGPTKSENALSRRCYAGL